IVSVQMEEISCPRVQLEFLALFCTGSLSALLTNQIPPSLCAGESTRTTLTVSPPPTPPSTGPN
ncbi:hypothetical protein M9458_017294, partial [Cirrhinus mrigala]